MVHPSLFDNFKANGRVAFGKVSQVRAFLAGHGNRRDFRSAIYTPGTLPALKVSHPGLYRALLTHQECEHQLRGRWNRGSHFRTRLLQLGNTLGLFSVIPPLRMWIWDADQQLALKALRIFRKVRYHTPFMKIQDVLSYCSIDTLALSAFTPDAVHVPAYASGCFTKSNIEYGYLLGIDVITTPQGIYGIEANVSPGVDHKRQPLYEDDLIADKCIELATSLQTETLILDWGWNMPAHPWFRNRLIMLAAKANLNLHICLDPRVMKQSIYPEATTLRPEKLAKGKTLVIRTKNNLAGQDFLVSQKHTFCATLGQYKQAHPDAHFSVAEMSAEPKAEWIQVGHQLPNLVYKYVEEDRGTGVYFIRATDVEHARRVAKQIDSRTGLSGGLFQPFIISTLLNGRQCYDVRAYLFLTPSMLLYAGALRRISPSLLPDFVDVGEVKDASAFLANVSKGGAVTICSDEEEQAVRVTTEEIGIAIREKLSQVFRVQG